MAFDHKAFLKTVPSLPGVYRMYGEDEALLYVGKARNLKNRVSSYFNKSVKSPKTEALVQQIASVQITVTHTEGEALLLESNLIKEFQPRYNILLRDDKSYPYIYVTDHQYPRLSIYRGAKPKSGRVFGPYPSAYAARETLKLMQKIFPVRQCEDYFYAHRSRPCLQYQIKRCTAPCVGLVSPEQYQEDLQHAIKFLDGKNKALVDELGEQMMQASESLQFEKAAELRDKIQTLSKVQEKQFVDGGAQNVDVVAGLVERGVHVVQVFSVRDGRNLGNREFFPKTIGSSSVPELLQEFIGQYYAQRKAPGLILANEIPEEQAVLEAGLSAQAARNVSISVPSRGDRKRWLNMALNNARLAIERHLAQNTQLAERFEALQLALDLAEQPKRMECFDISHHSGEQAQASCVVMNENGIAKSEYRRFKMKDIEAGDDYAAIYQAVYRRYKRVVEEEKPLPDLLIIDGGKGQVNKAKEALDELQLEMPLIGIAKGPERRAGDEVIVFPGKQKDLRLGSHHAGLHLLMQIRDEAHRFAISGVRQQRDKKRSQSSLETIEGLGPKRRKALLQHFGGLARIREAGIDDLTQVNGVSPKMAQRIYDYFHAE